MNPNIYKIINKLIIKIMVGFQGSYVTPEVEGPGTASSGPGLKPAGDTCGGR